MNLPTFAVAKTPLVPWFQSGATVAARSWAGGGSTFFVGQPKEKTRAAGSIQRTPKWALMCAAKKMARNRKMEHE